MTSSASTLALPARAGAGVRLRAYISLTKPRIVELLLVTTVPTMIVAAGGWPPLRTVLATVVGGTLAAGGANAANMYIDRDIDALMSRTVHRPLVTGQVSATGALAFSVALEIGAFSLLWTMVNELSALLTLGAALFYVLVYTLLLKRSSSQNIVIGGAAGAVPVLVGWAAVTGRLSWAPVALFALVFLWTPPHFWALAIRYRDDYATARVPMMPVVKTAKHTASQAVGYAVATVGASCLFGVLAHMRLTYWSVAAVSGSVLVVLAVRLLRASTTDKMAGTSAVAMKLFHWSITYLSLVFVAMALDVLVR
ncbi:MAG: heme o synthase [Acidimicrobiales bacterium]